MSLKKLFFLIKDDEGLSASLNLDAFLGLIADSEEFKELLLDLSSLEIDLLIKTLADANRTEELSALVEFISKNEIDHNPSTLVASLLTLKLIDSSEFFIKNPTVLLNVTPKEALPLSPFMSLFPTKYQKLVEASLLQRKTAVEEFKEHLQDQIEFLKSQHLTEKALEYEKKMAFHFSETTRDLKTYEKSVKKNKDQNYAHVIERNLSFESRNKERLTTSSKKILENLKKDNASNLELAELWYTELKEKNIELLLTQLELMDFNNSSFYEKVLTENQNLPLWTQTFLFIKSKKFLEGLEFLAFNESHLLTDSADSIYNYYYTKGVMLLGAGMQKEAEEIFSIIQEQKGNYRDIQLLLKEAK